MATIEGSFAKGSKVPMNLLLDTNVLIDYLGRKEPFFESAKMVVMAAFFGDVRAWTPAQSVVDAFYVLSRYMDSDRIQQSILKTLELISPVDLTSADLERAARLKWPDMEDCLISVAAVKANADYLITRDASGFERSPVPVLTPQAWIQLMREKHGLEYGEEPF